MTKILLSRFFFDKNITFKIFKNIFENKQFQTYLEASLTHLILHTKKTFCPLLWHNLK